MREKSVYSALNHPLFYVVKYKGEKYIGEPESEKDDYGPLVDNLDDALIFEDFNDAKFAIMDFVDYNINIEDEISSSDLERLKRDEMKDYGDDYESEEKGSLGLIDDYPVKEMIRDNFEVKPIYASKFEESKDMPKLRERRWIATVPESISKEFFDQINSDDPDYEEVRKALIDILNFVKNKVGEDDFYEDSLIDDLEWCDLESDEDCDYYINEMYDVLDAYGIFMDPIY